MPGHVSEEEALRFIFDQIDSIPHLEALLLLSEREQRPWTASEIADRLYIRTERANEVLGDLVHRRLILVKDEPPQQSFYFHPDEELRPMIDAVTDIYRRQLVRVTSLVHSKASASVREFAKAFKFTKGDR